MKILYTAAVFTIHKFQLTLYKELQYKDLNHEIVTRKGGWPYVQLEYSIFLSLKIHFAHNSLSQAKIQN